MALITMWDRGDRKCVFVVAKGTNQPYRLYIVQGQAVVRIESMHSPDDAILASKMWLAQEPQSLASQMSAA